MSIFNAVAPNVPHLRKQFKDLFDCAAKADMSGFPDEMAENFGSVMKSLYWSAPGADSELDRQSYLAPEHRGAIEVLGYRIDFALEIVATPVIYRGGPSHDGMGKVSFRLRGALEPFFHFFLDSNGAIASEIPGKSGDARWTAHVTNSHDARQCVMRVFEAFLATVEVPAAD